MKLKIANPSPGAPPTVRGSVYVVDMPSGPVARAWPRGRGAATTGYEFYKQREFAIAAYMAANPMALDMGTAIEMVRGTQYVPRDFLMSAAYGRAYIIQQENGFTWPIYRDMAPNPQYVLDLITTTVGSMIWRDQIGWVAVPPGNNGEILTWSNGPEWAENSGGGGGGGGATWQLVADWTWSANVQYVEFPALTFDEYLVIGQNLQSSTSTNKVIQLSTDGGTTFYSTSGDYWALNSSGNPTVASGILVTGASSSDGRWFLANLHNMKAAGIPKLGNRVGDAGYLLNASTDPVTGVRVGVTSGLLTAGSIWLMGRG